MTFFQTMWLSQHQKDLVFSEARDDGVTVALAGCANYL